MNAIVMAGGCSTRMKSDAEKLLLEINGKAMAVHTVKILSDSGLFEHVLCATSANAPKTAKVLTDAGVQTVHTAGRGYSEDLGEVLESMQGKVLIISGDMPLLDLQTLKHMIKLCKKDSIWTSFVMTKKFSGILGITGPEIENGCVHTGAMLVDASAYAGKNISIKEDYVIFDEIKLGTNINTMQDYERLVNFA